LNRTVNNNENHRDGSVSVLFNLANRSEIVNIWSRTGSTDYLLQVFCRNLAALNRLVHEGFLTQPAISHVESKIVMEQIKAGTALPLEPS